MRPQTPQRTRTLGASRWPRSPGPRERGGSSGTAPRVSLAWALAAQALAALTAPAAGAAGPPKPPPLEAPAGPGGAAAHAATSRPPDAQEATGSPPTRPARASPTLDPHRLEIGAIPILSANSDEGYGLGLAVSFARFRPSAHPYLWRARGIVYLTLRQGVDDRLEVPVQDHGVDLDLPELGGTPYRLGVRAGYRRKIVQYSGLGGRKLTQRPPGREGVRRYFQYNRAEAYLETRHRLPLGGRFFGALDLEGHFWWPEVLPDSKLADDLAGRADVDAEYVSRALHGTRRHLQLKAGLALQWDARDDEVSPASGMFHDLSVFAAGGMAGETFTYFGAQGAARFYVPLLGPRLVLALRARADLRWGAPPVYDLLVLGQETLLRGIPNGLLNGRASVLGTAELRSMFLPFRVLGQRLTLGAVAFADAGALWADALDPQPALDPAPRDALNVGVGGGLRLLWGRSFVLRFDVAWSPDGVGYYVNVDETF